MLDIRTYTPRGLGDAPRTWIHAWRLARTCGALCGRALDHVLLTLLGAGGRDVFAATSASPIWSTTIAAVAYATLKSPGSGGRRVHVTCGALLDAHLSRAEHVATFVSHTFIPHVGSVRDCNADGTRQACSTITTACPCFWRCAAGGLAWGGRCQEAAGAPRVSGTASEDPTEPR